MKYGLVLKEKYGIDGLSKDEVIEMFDSLEDTPVFPLELQARECEFSAMGFITIKSAKLVDYDYESSGLHDFIANILDGNTPKTPNGEYEFEGIKILLTV